MLMIAERAEDAEPRRKLLGLPASASDDAMLAAPPP